MRRLLSAIGLAAGGIAALVLAAPGLTLASAPMLSPPSISVSGAAISDALAHDGGRMPRLPNQGGSQPRPMAAPAPGKPAVQLTPAPAAAPHAALPRTVFSFYYPWYSGAPQYLHWAGSTPGRLVGTSIPALGPYDSRDTAGAVDLHMRWARYAGIDVLVLDWWGRGDFTDAAVKGIMDKAAQYGIKVAFMIDAYAGRTAASTAQDVAYLYSAYGSHAAFFRASRPTLYGPSPSPRGIFFVYAPSGSGWPQAFDGLHGTTNDAILLVRTDDTQLLSDGGVTGQINAFHADGLFNFGYYAFPYQSTALPASPNYLLVYAVQPGFDNTASGGSTLLARSGGATYDQVWLPLALQKPEAIAIDSWNEWAETSQIEPALPNGNGLYSHLDYDGAYGLTGLSAAAAYILRTNQWTTFYKSL
jgi:hypothetical protein